MASARPRDKIARVRAQLLHILYELGKDDHLFRLRYKGQILRDAFTLEDYEIGDNAILTMMPVGKSQEVWKLVINKYSSINVAFDLLMVFFFFFQFISYWKQNGNGCRFHDKNSFLFLSMVINHLYIHWKAQMIIAKAYRWLS